MLPLKKTILVLLALHAIPVSAQIMPLPRHLPVQEGTVPILPPYVLCKGVTVGMSLEQALVAMGHHPDSAVSDPARLQPGEVARTRALEWYAGEDGSHVTTRITFVQDAVDEIICKQHLVSEPLGPLPKL
jgi:hypothetical protein